MERDIRNLRKALKILKQYDSEEMYQKIMKQTLFSKGCRGNCYYREKRGSQIKFYLFGVRHIVKEMSSLE